MIYLEFVRLPLRHNPSEADKLEAMKRLPEPLPDTPLRKLRRAVKEAIPHSVLVLRGPRRGHGRKRVALTFDDGPDPMTSAYLDVLDRFRAKATFFVIGELAQLRRVALLDIARAGHEIASHGLTHTPFPELDGAMLLDELGATDDALLPGRSPRPLVRPPRGELDPTTLVRMAAAGYTAVLWSLDSNDCRTSDPRLIADELAPERLEDGDIVLMHEGQSWTLAALELALARLRDSEVELCTVSELLGF